MNSDAQPTPSASEIAMATDDPTNPALLPADFPNRAALIAAVRPTFAIDERIVDAVWSSPHYGRAGVVVHAGTDERSVSIRFDGATAARPMRCAGLVAA